VSRLGVDHIGVLVGDGAFPRELPPERAREIFAASPSQSRRVALSLSADLAEAVRVAHESRPDLLQVQAAPAEFSPAMLRELKERCPGIAIIRAIPVVDAGAVGIARSYVGLADFLLLDSYEPASRQFGALGRVHDWRLSRRIVEEVPIPAILAGGLGPANVAAAIAAVGPAGVDSKTLTDRPGGTGKDLEKVREFVSAARLAGRSGIG
jgi:phosphoribosylanthranilate isomerase